MKQKIVIILSVLLLLAALVLITLDFFSEPGERANPYEYGMSDFRKVDDSLICCDEVQKFSFEMEKPNGIAVDESDKIYIVGEGKLLIFDLEGIIASEIFLSGEATCIHVFDEQIFLGMTDHVEVLDLDGNLTSNWETLNERVFISSICTKDESVFVADAGNKIVYHYDHFGQMVNEIGRKDESAGIPGFVIPSPYFDVAIGHGGELWVVNPGLHTFEQYTPDGTLVSSWKRTSMQLDGFSGCCNPGHIAILSDGSFVTSEKGIERVKIHLPSGDFKCVVATPGSFDAGTTGLDLAVDSEGQIIILDPVRKQIRVFNQRRE
nr:hypothetical protein [Bacteroidota bacterium]